MATDVRLDQGSDGSWVSVDAPVLAVAGHDLIIDAAERRTDPRGFRRALVHDGGDVLTINFAGDYPGGVRINDARVQVHVETQGRQPRLPREGVIGDLLVTHNVTRIENGPVIGGTTTLWLCLGANPIELINGGATWVPITTGAPVTGDA